MEGGDLIPKKNSMGFIIWQWFGYCKVDIEQNVCKVCRKPIATKSSSKTANEGCVKLCMFTSAPTLNKMQKEPSQKQMTLAASFAKSILYEKKHAKWREITNEITKHVTRDMVPVNTVEKPGVKNLIQMLDLKYQLPGRKFFCLESATEVVYFSERKR